jgi:hypothetical protein
MTNKIRKNVYIDGDIAAGMKKWADHNCLSFSQAVTIAGLWMIDNPAHALRKKDEGRTEEEAWSEFLED